MSTAEAPVFADNIKTLGDSIVKLTVLEAKALGDYLEVVHGIKPAAAAVAAGPAAAAAGPAAPGKNKPSSRHPRSDRRQQDQRHQGSPHGDQPWPQGSQGPGRGRAEGGQDRLLQGRRREAQEGPRRRRRHGQDQVIEAGPAALGFPTGALGGMSRPPGVPMSTPRDATPLLDKADAGGTFLSEDEFGSPYATAPARSHCPKPFVPGSWRSVADDV